jgi:hypothetical protein
MAGQPVLPDPEQPTLPTLPAAVREAPFAHLNEAKSHAQKIAFDMVEFLSRVVADDEESMELRVTAAAEILSFARTPY